MSLDNFEPVPVKPEISYDELDKIDVRVGTIVSVDDVEGGDKRMKLTVDFGNHRRTILAAIKEERAHPGEIAGQQALFVVNLKPRRMLGQISEGMLFDIGYADGLMPRLAVPEVVVPDGTRAG